MISGLKTKGGIQDGCQNIIFQDFNCFAIYLYGIHICASSGLDTDIIESN